MHIFNLTDGHWFTLVAVLMCRYSVRALFTLRNAYEWTAYCSFFLISFFIYVFAMNPWYMTVDITFWAIIFQLIQLDADQSPMQSTSGAHSRSAHNSHKYHFYPSFYMMCIGFIFTFLLLFPLLHQFFPISFSLALSLFLCLSASLFICSLFLSEKVIAIWLAFLGILR